MKTLVSLILCLASLLACADEEALNIDTSSPQFTVTLASNPTTGYQWSVVDFNKNLFTLESAVYQRPQTKLIGAGGNMVFTFNLNKGKNYPSTSQMIFNYARPWESSGGTIKKLSLNFKSN